MTTKSVYCACTGVVKYVMGGKQKPESFDQQQSHVLCLLCASALDMLDSVRSAFNTKGLELEVQRYRSVQPKTFFVCCRTSLDRARFFNHQRILQDML